MRISKKTVSKKDPMCQRCPCPVWFNLDVGKYEAKSMEDQRDHALGTGQAYEGRMPSLINSLGKILLPALEHKSVCHPSPRGAYPQLTGEMTHQQRRKHAQLLCAHEFKAPNVPRGTSEATTYVDDSASASMDLVTSIALSTQKSDFSPH